MNPLRAVHLLKVIRFNYGAQQVANTGLPLRPLVFTEVSQLEGIPGDNVGKSLITVDNYPKTVGKSGKNLWVKNPNKALQ